MLTRPAPAAVLAAALLVTASAAAAQERSGAPAPPAPAAAVSANLTPQALEAALTEIERLVGERYFDAAKRPAVLAVLTEGRRSGRYAGIDAETLASRVSDDLKRVTGDGHMYLRWDPRQHSAQLAAGAATPDRSFFDERTRRGHHGLQETRILPGNVRYLKISSFGMWNDETSPAAYDAAMRFLREGDAVVIDLRGNGGGFAEPVEYVLSHFLPPNVLMHTSVLASEQLPAFTANELPAGRMVGKPLYVLIDKGCASATEALALSVDKFKLGELIGQTTTGAGHRNRYFPVAPGFLLSLSTGTVRHGLDGAGWEGTGVAPHVAVPPEGALEVAHVRALERLAETGPQPLRAEFAWHAEAARAKLAPASVPATELAKFAGRYGDRIIEVRDGRLFSKRGDGPEYALTPMSPDTFLLGETSRLRFETRGGRVTGVTLLGLGRAATTPRDS